MLCERYTNSAALVSKQHECRYGRHSFGGTIYETLFIMFGPGGASGPYTLVMSERCIPCERILCERYTNGAALLLSLANNMNVDMGDIRSQHFRNVVYHVWARWCIRPIHASYAGAVHSM